MYSQQSAMSAATRDQGSQLRAQKTYARESADSTAYVYTYDT